MMKKFVCFLIIIQSVYGLRATEQEPESKMTFIHPDKNGYQSVVTGSDKHKYGYELKENKHFHHTTTEKDGVRLGCYGYELEGKKYSTQYVADSRGYRIVSNQDLITVYPKSGGKRKASFRRQFNEDPSLSENIRYFFPDGCKGIDILIDNSSRLRSIAPPMSEVIARLPVTMKPSTVSDIVYSTHPNTYIPPGPPHIYAPNQIHIPVKPPIDYLPPTMLSTQATPTNTYLPPSDPSNIYLPPKNPENAYLPPEDPSNEYLPPIDKPHRPPHISTLDLLPPFVPAGNCCCDDSSSSGRFVIPVPLKFQDSKLIARIVLPINGMNKESVLKLSKAFTDEIDGNELIRNILQNLL